MSETSNRYTKLIETVFFDHYSKGAEELYFYRDELKPTADRLGIELPKNLGDVIYSFRFRNEMPSTLIELQPEDREWVIELAGREGRRTRYRFALRSTNRIVPRDDMDVIEIPDATPEIIRMYTLDDEQALLAIIRYNRLIDIFLGITTYSLQNHLRTTVKGVGQIEIDELYIGLDKHGCHYVIPVQAKGGSDQIGFVQIDQDIKFASQKFPDLRCRAIAAQFLSDDTVVLFELVVKEDELRVVEERHYKLVAGDSLDRSATTRYRV